jgi:hypothetical protein
VTPCDILPLARMLSSFSAHFVPLDVRWTVGRGLTDCLVGGCKMVGVSVSEVARGSAHLARERETVSNRQRELVLASLLLAPTRAGNSRAGNPRGYGRDSRTRGMR